MSSSQEKKCSAGKSVLPVGENRSGLTPAIPFCEPKVDEDNDDVELIDLTKAMSDKTNIDIKTFPSMKHLIGSGLQVLKLRRSLTIVIFKFEVLIGPLSIEKRLAYFRALGKK